MTRISRPGRTLRQTGLNCLLHLKISLNSGKALSGAHTTGLTSLAEARLCDCIRPAVWSANVTVASGSSPGRWDSVSKHAEEGVPWIQPQQWQEGMRGFLSEAGFHFCFKTPYLCQVMSASTHLTACLALFFFFCFWISSSSRQCPCLPCLWPATSLYFLSTPPLSPSSATLLLLKPGNRRLL